MTGDTPQESGHTSGAESAEIQNPDPDDLSGYGTAGEEKTVVADSGTASAWPSWLGAARPAGWFLSASGEAAPPEMPGTEPARADAAQSAGPSPDDPSPADHPGRAGISERAEVNAPTGPSTLTGVPGRGEPDPDERAGQPSADGRAEYSPARTSGPGSRPGRVFTGPGRGCPSRAGRPGRGGCAVRGGRLRARRRLVRGPAANVGPPDPAALVTAARAAVRSLAGRVHGPPRPRPATGMSRATTAGRTRQGPRLPGDWYEPGYDGRRTRQGPRLPRRLVRAGLRSPAGRAGIRAAARRDVAGDVAREPAGESWGPAVGQPRGYRTPPREPRFVPVVGPTAALRGRAGGPGFVVPPGAVPGLYDPARRSGWQLAAGVWDESGVSWEPPVAAPLPGPGWSEYGRGGGPHSQSPAADDYGQDERAGAQRPRLRGSAGLLRRARLRGRGQLRRSAHLRRRALRRRPPPPTRPRRRGPALLRCPISGGTASPATAPVSWTSCTGPGRARSARRPGRRGRG